MIAMVLGACFGAYFQLNFLSAAAAPIAATVTETISNDAGAQKTDIWIPNEE